MRSLGRALVSDAVIKTIYFLISNGLVILIGQSTLLFIPGDAIPRITVVVLCIWNYVLGRALDRTARDNGF